MSNEWADKWIGIAGGGFGFSLIGGVGVYQLNLYNLSGNPVPIQALIVGKRLGLTAQAELAHAVCLMSGVKSESEFDTLSSSGFDWAASLGIKADAIIKTGSKAFDALLTVAKYAENARWATSEAAKGFVRYASNDLSLDLSQKQFYLVPTPVALGIGAGIWYEWQTLYKTGTDLAWKYAPPKWGIETPGGRMLLRMKGIPERDHSSICLRIRKDTWGYDDTIRFAGHASVGNFGERGTRSANLFGSVHRGKLYGSGKAGRGQDGIDLSALTPLGKTVTGMASVYSNTDVDKNENFKIGISVSKNRSNMYKWESDDYIRVTSDASGRLSGRVDPDYWYD